MSGRPKYVTRDGFVVGVDGISSINLDFEWRVERDPYGQPVVRGADGVDPLHHPDPVVRLRAAYLVAEAPHAKDVLLAALNCLRPTASSYAPHAKVWNAGWMSVLAGKPPFVDVDKLLREGGQGHLDLEHVA